MVNERTIPHQIYNNVVINYQESRFFEGGKMDKKIGRAKTKVEENPDHDKG